MDARTNDNSQDWQNHNRNGLPPSPPNMARSGVISHQRQRNDESWVEVSSHPSSSSVSSTGEEIVTTGLRVGSSAYTRRRRLHPQTYNHLLAQQQQQQIAAHLATQATHAGTSSQEEYEESETDSDPILMSSNENVKSVPSPGSTPLRIVHPPQDNTSDEEEDDDDDDDENATALGSRRPSEPFRPQPNAFSHPPSHLQHRHSTSSSIPQHHPRPSFSQRNSARFTDRRSPEFISPNYQADNDAALRASLTTLLSCAAGARGRSRDGDKELGERPGLSGAQPMSLHLVPESELMDTAPRPTAQGRVLRTEPRPSPPAPSGQVAMGSEKVKRAATPTMPSKSPRAAKKKRTTSPSSAEEAFISPTLLTWVVSAGVVVLVSVVGFGAGYVIGREVGRQEAIGSLGAVNASSAVADGGSCGREIIRSSSGTLKRFRWGGSMGKAITA